MPDQSCLLHPVHEACRTISFVYFLKSLWNIKSDFKLHQINPQLGESLYTLMQISTYVNIK